MYQENLSPNPTAYSPRKIHATFFLSEMILDASSRISNSGISRGIFFKEKFEGDKPFLISH